MRDYHAKLIAHKLTRRCASDRGEKHFETLGVPFKVSVSTDYV